MNRHVAEFDLRILSLSALEDMASGDGPKACAAMSELERRILTIRIAHECADWVKHL